MRKTTWREYLGWQRYFEEEWDENTKEHYYLAQIALEVRRVLAKKPNAIKLKDFLLSFVTNRKQKKEEGAGVDFEAMTPEQKQEYLDYISNVSKAVWKVRTTINPNAPKNLPLKGSDNGR